MENKNNSKKESKLFYYLQVFLDVIIILLGYYLALKIRFNSPFEIEKQFGIFFNIYPYIIISSLVFIYFYRTFDVVYRKYFELMYSIFLLLILIQLSTMAITFFTRDFGFARSIFFISFIIQFIGFAILKDISIRIYEKIYGRKNLMVVEGSEKAESIVSKIKGERNFNVKHILESYDKSKVNEVDAVAIGCNVDRETKNSIIDDFMREGKTVFIVPDFPEISIHKSNLSNFDDLLVFEMGTYSLNFEEKLFKRISDLLISLLGLIVLSPVIILTAILIKLYDGGSVLYKQERLTFNKEKFTLYKFRSMVEEAEKKTGPALVKENDERITPVGKFIRSTRIDELPQLFNVIKGDMSLIGPRPEREYFVEEFSKNIPNYNLRFNVKAGITGLAQVNGKYTTNPEDKLRYDLIYISEYSVLLDIEIFIQTIKVMLMKVSSKGE